MKILQLMFFQAERVYQYKKEGNEHQLHNLYGYDRFREMEGITVKCLSVNQKKFNAFKSSPRLNRILLEFRLIFLQCKCAIISRKFDVIYSPHDFHLLPLAILRMMRICPKPIFAISHFAYSPELIDKKIAKFYRRIERFFVYRAIDRISFLNDNLLKVAIRAYNVPIRHRTSIDWGANLGFFQNYVASLNEPSRNDYFMSLGTQNRDYKILAKAFSKLSLPLIVYSKKNIQEEIPDNIIFDDSIIPGLDSVSKLRLCYYNSIAVLVPIIRTTDIPNGASVIIEALAMGKPIIITDFQINYIDVEKEGIGFKIKPGDVAGWINAIEWLMNHPEKTKEMGQKALKLAKEKYNYNLFVDRVLNYLKQLNT